MEASIKELEKIYAEYQKKGYEFGLVLVKASGDEHNSLLSSINKRGYKIPVYYSKYPATTWKKYIKSMKNLSKINPTSSSLKPGICKNGKTKSTAPKAH